MNALDKATKLSYDLFKQSLENTIEDDKYRMYTYPVNQMHGAQSEIPAFLINIYKKEYTNSDRTTRLLQRWNLLFVSIYRIGLGLQTLQSKLYIFIGAHHDGCWEAESV